MRKGTNYVVFKTFICILQNNACYALSYFVEQITFSYLFCNYTVQLFNFGLNILSIAYILHSMKSQRAVVISLIITAVNKPLKSFIGYSASLICGITTVQKGHGVSSSYSYM